MERPVSGRRPAGHAKAGGPKAKSGVNPAAPPPTTPGRPGPSGLHVVLNINVDLGDKRPFAVIEYARQVRELYEKRFGRLGDGS